MSEPRRPDASAVVRADGVDLALTLGPTRNGPFDPSCRREGRALWRAMRTPLGAAAARFEDRRDGTVAVDAWGPGAPAVVDRAPALVGARDRRDGWEPRAHPLVAELDRRRPGLRFPSGWPVLPAAVAAVLAQKITAEEAHAAWKAIVVAHGERAPGGPARLTLPPSGARLASLPYYALHPLGVERRRSEVIRNLAAREGRVEEAATLGPVGARRRLTAFAGVGRWTVATVAQIAWGDADAVQVGDYHVAKIVVYAFTGRRGGDDDAMLELLEPFRGHRARVARLLKHSGLGPPRRGPRNGVRDYAAM